MFFVAHFSILGSLKVKKFLDFQFVFVHRVLTIFIMPAVITDKSRHVSNQSQRAILPDVTCAITVIHNQSFKCFIKGSEVFTRDPNYPKCFFKPNQTKG